MNLQRVRANVYLFISGPSTIWLHHRVDPGTFFWEGQVVSFMKKVHPIQSADILLIIWINEYRVVSGKKLPDRESNPGSRI